MAIDTENKRRSVLGVLPVPDGSIDAPDKLHLWEIYSGITISETAAASTEPEHRMPNRLRRPR